MINRTMIDQYALSSIIIDYPRLLLIISSMIFSYPRLLISCQLTTINQHSWMSPDSCCLLLVIKHNHQPLIHHHHQNTPSIDNHLQPPRKRVDNSINHDQNHHKNSLLMLINHHKPPHFEARHGAAHWSTARVTRQVVSGTTGRRPTGFPTAPWDAGNAPRETSWEMEEIAGVADGGWL